MRRKERVGNVRRGDKERVSYGVLIRLKIWDDSIYPSIHPSIHSSIHPSIHPSIHSFILPSLALTLSPSIPSFTYSRTPSPQAYHRKHGSNEPSPAVSNT
jgi:hypothetical protein